VAGRDFFADGELGCESHRRNWARRVTPESFLAVLDWNTCLTIRGVVAELVETPARFSTYAHAC